MQDFGFPEYVRCLKEALRSHTSNSDVVNMLLGTITDGMNWRDKSGNPFYMVSATVSMILNRKRDVPQYIKELCSSPSCPPKVRDKIEELVLPQLNVSLGDDMFEAMKKAVENDGRMAQAKKDELLDVLARDERAEFLTQLLLYVVAIDNLLSSSGSSQSEQDSAIPVLRPDTHYNLIVCTDIELYGKKEFILSHRVMTECLDESLTEAFRSHPEEMKKQMLALPCIFSQDDDSPLPTDVDDILIPRHKKFGFGYIEKCDIASKTDIDGKAYDVVASIVPRIEKRIAQYRLFDHYVAIGLQKKFSLYCPQWTVIKNDLVATLQKLGVKIKNK